MGCLFGFIVSFLGAGILNIATGVSIVTLLLTAVFGPLQTLLKTTSLDVRQWLICLAVALSIVVLAEIRKAVRRHNAPEMGRSPELTLPG